MLNTIFTFVNHKSSSNSHKFNIIPLVLNASNKPFTSKLISILNQKNLKFY